nr:L-threonylcarbamoyladenylate synthase [Salidesulfovibrio onnuriiensis]
MDKVLEALRGGGVVVYPTETLYAIGCMATDHAACVRVAATKARDMGKPLPLIIGSLQGLEAVTGDVPDMVRELAGAFWPGPLSILVKARKGLSPLVSDDEGYTSVRLSPHPVAAELSRRAEAPLVATSANRSGLPATADPDRLDPALLAGVDAAYLEEPRPLGGEPSTVVRVLGDRHLEIVRLGAVGVEQLCQKGFVPA